MTINHLKHSPTLSPAFLGVYSTYVLFAPVGEATDAVPVAKNCGSGGSRTVCVWPIVVPLMTVTISVEISVVVPILVLVGTRIKVCLFWPPVSSLLFPLIARLRTRRAFTAVSCTLRLQFKCFKHYSLVAFAVALYVTLESDSEFIV